MLNVHFDHSEAATVAKAGVYQGSASFGILAHGYAEQGSSGKKNSRFSRVRLENHILRHWSPEKLSEALQEGPGDLRPQESPGNSQESPRDPHEPSRTAAQKTPKRSPEPYSLLLMGGRRQ